MKSPHSHLDLILIGTGREFTLDMAGQACFAALDLGTNNCRLLVAKPEADSFTIVDSFSRIVRLGEGLASSGHLSQAAQDRTIDALRVCARKIGQYHISDAAFVATEACRAARNGPEFMMRVKRETGLQFHVLDTHQESYFAALSCADLVAPDAELALVVDIGGGSTELSFVDGRAARAGGRDWTRLVRRTRSFPLGVVALAERFQHIQGREIYEAMLALCHATLADWQDGLSLIGEFAAGGGHLIGTSGTMTSLAGVHLGLRRYQRHLVDGLWMDGEAVRAASERLIAMDPQQRAAQASIGANRADLVVAGCAIFEAVCALWPAARIRVADRGLREGLLLTMVRAPERPAGVTLGAFLVDAGDRTEPDRPLASTIHRSETGAGTMEGQPPSSSGSDSHEAPHGG